MKNLVKKFFVFFVLVGMFGGVAADAIDDQMQTIETLLNQPRPDMSQIQQLIQNVPSALTEAQTRRIEQLRIKFRSFQPRASSLPGYSQQQYQPQPAQYGQPAMAAPQPTAIAAKRRLRREIDILQLGASSPPTAETAIENFIGKLEALAGEVDKIGDTKIITQFNELLDSIPTSADSRINASVTGIKTDYRFTPATPAAGASAAATIQTLRGKIRQGGKTITDAINKLAQTRLTMARALGTEEATTLELQRNVPAQLKQLKKRFLGTQTAANYAEILLAAFNSINPVAIKYDTLPDNLKLEFKRAVKNFIEEAKKHTKRGLISGVKGKARAVLSPEDKEGHYSAFRNAQQDAAGNNFSGNVIFTKLFHDHLLARLQDIEKQKKSLHNTNLLETYKTIIKAVQDIINKNPLLHLDVLFQDTIREFVIEAEKKSEVGEGISFNTKKRKSLVDFLSNMKKTAYALHWYLEQKITMPTEHA
jgi:hypothetical protein